VISPWGKNAYRIAGVVETTRLGGPAQEGPPMIYFAVQEEPMPNLAFVAHVNGDAAKYVAMCRDALRSIDPEVPVYDAGTLADRLDTVLARPRFFFNAIVALTAIAFLLAVAGTFGSAAHAVAQRTREFGVRMALGSTYARVRGLLLRETVAPAAVGCGAGIALAITEGRYLGHLLSDVRGLPAWTCALAAVVLLAATVIATWAATARLRSVDPAVAIRSE
jgi:predicted lysophospholipase L1 biosynthesis ABC-type transport system permease subunit